MRHRTFTTAELAALSAKEAEARRKIDAAGTPENQHPAAMAIKGKSDWISAMWRRVIGGLKP